MQKKIEHPSFALHKELSQSLWWKGWKGKNDGDDFLAARRFKALVGEWTPEELGRFFLADVGRYATGQNLSRSCQSAGLLHSTCCCCVCCIVLFPTAVRCLLALVQFVAMQLNVHPKHLLSTGCDGPRRVMNILSRSGPS